jgi:hypothetical protein
VGRTRTRPALRAGTPQLALGALLACGVAVALGAAGTRYQQLNGIGAPLPQWVLGPLGGLGWDLHGPALCALLAAMVGCYLLVVRHATALSARAGIAAVLALHATFLLAPPLLSSDVFNYLDASRLEAIYGLNPYLAAPLARSGDVAFALTGAPWQHSPSVYGPGFTALAAALAPFGAAAELWALKALAALASLGCTALVWSCARKLGRPPLQAALSWGLNPLVLVLAVGGAHNDLLMVLLVLAALALLLHDRAEVALATLAGATAVKLTALLLLPYMALGAGAGPRVRRAAATALGALVLLATLTYLRYGDAPLHVARTLDDGAARHVGELRSLPGFLAGYAGLGPIGAGGRTLLDLLCLGVLGLLAWRAARGRLPWLSAACWALLALLLTSTRFEPWYGIWVVPLAALSGEKRVRAASHALLLGIAGVAFARYALRLGIHYPHGG